MDPLVVRIVFDNNSAPDASYQLPCAQAVRCRFIVPVSRYSDFAGCNEALHSGKGPTHRDSRTHPDYHILIVRGKITNLRIHRAPRPLCLPSGRGQR